MIDVPVEDLQEAALQLARKNIVTSVANPFTRSSWGKAFYFDDIGTREQALEAVLQVFRDEIGDKIDPMPGENFQSAYNKPGQLPINHLPQWTRLVATTYSKSPTRYFRYKDEMPAEGSPAHELAERIADYYREASVDTVLQDVDAMQFLVGNACIIPWYDVENKELVLHYYASPNIRVVEHPNNPKRPRATVISGSSIERDSNANGRKVAVAQAWLPGQMLLTKNGELVAQVPFAGPSPVVHFFEYNPTESYYVHANGLHLAHIAMMLLNDHYNSAGHLVVMQAGGLLVLKGWPGDQTLSVGPGSAIKLPADVSGGGGASGESRDVFYVSPNADIAAVMEFVDWALDKIQQSAGIPNDPFSEMGGGLSGRAIVEAKQPLIERRMARFERFRRPERELLQAILWQLKRANVEGFGDVVPEDWDVRVSFPDPNAPTNVADKALAEKTDVELGIRDAAQILRDREPAKFDSAEDAEESLPDVEEPEPESGIDAGGKKDTV